MGRVEGMKKISRKQKIQKNIPFFACWVIRSSSRLKVIVFGLSRDNAPSLDYAWRAVRWSLTIIDKAFPKIKNLPPSNWKFCSPKCKKNKNSPLRAFECFLSKNIRPGIPEHGYSVVQITNEVFTGKSHHKFNYSIYSTLNHSLPCPFQGALHHHNSWTYKFELDLVQRDPKIFGACLYYNRISGLRYYLLNSILVTWDLKFPSRQNYLWYLTVLATSHISKDPIKEA